MQKILRFIIVGCLLAVAILGIQNSQVRYAQFTPQENSIADPDNLLQRNEKQKLQTLAYQLQQDYGLKVNIRLEKATSQKNSLTLNSEKDTNLLKICIYLSPKQITLTVPPLAKMVLSDDFLLPLKDTLLSDLDQDKIPENALLFFLEKIVERLNTTTN